MSPDPRSQDPGSRYQRIDKVTLLAQCPLFSGLSQWELKSISQLMRLVEYKKGELVYREGEEADGFYVVVSGRFEAASSAIDLKKKVLAYLRRGDYFGEMSLLTNQPHSATLKALSDSLVLFLRKDDFKNTIEHNATISVELSRRLSSRLKGVDPLSRSLFRSDVISIFGNQRGIGRTAFSINLAASLFQETGQKTVLLDMSPSGSEIASRLHMARKLPLTHFQNMESAPLDALTDYIVKHPAGFEVLSVAHDDSDRLGEQMITPLLNHLAIDYRFILIDLPEGLDETVHKALTQSDCVYVVTDSHINNITETRETVDEIEKGLSLSDDRVSVVINEAFFGVRTTTHTRREFFGKRTCYSLPAAPALKQLEEQTSMPYVVEQPNADYSRVVRHIARRISNNLVGLVLGSGAALGLAHIGVLKVLERENIPVDMIAGSSIGALIGSLYAVGKTASEIEQDALEINSRAKLARLMDATPFPVHGLMKGRKVMKRYNRHLGTRTFDETRIPLRIVGANLSTRQIMVFDSGFISDAVRVSIAIPAIFTPVIMSKDVVVDGGILSPLPIRALTEMGANKIIAVNVFPGSKEMVERRILVEEAAAKEAFLLRKRGPLVRAWRALQAGLAKKVSANIFDVLMNTIQSMESEIAEVEGEQADVLLRPVLSTASWVEFYNPIPFIRRGEEEAMRMLPKIRALVASQQGH
ncbi:MAG: hypothetical protein MOGMAGMI_00918 [Candidatus Omnitrophica bacterium]|nr:hypothetical protein [Candidatus Omnitrophota bacterium]